jgi:hypothetical protein
MSDQDLVSGSGEGPARPGCPGRSPDGFAGAGWSEEHHVLLRGDEIQGAKVGDGLALEGPLMVEVELLQALAGWEPGGADAALAAVGFPGGDLTLQTGGQELLMDQPSERACSASRPTAAVTEGAFSARAR